MLFLCRFDILSSRDFFFHWVETFFHWVDTFYYLKRRFYFYWANVGGEGGKKKRKEITSFGFFKEK